ncbi:hypothetical protein GCM10022237_34650 [Nocardioides ginsengisoli]
MAVRRTSAATASARTASATAVGASAPGAAVAAVRGRREGDEQGIVIGLTRAPIVTAGDALVHIASPVTS